MCEYCQERNRLAKIAMDDPQPCFICGDPEVVGVGTWVPDERHRLAAGGTKDTDRIFAYCLCDIHAQGTDENDKLIVQSILRTIREGKEFNV